MYWIALLVGATLLSAGPAAAVDSDSKHGDSPAVEKPAVEKPAPDRDGPNVEHCDKAQNDLTRMGNDIGHGDFGDAKDRALDYPGHLIECIKETFPSLTSNCTLKYTKGPRHTTRRP
jgi:hypothetical protein